MLFQQVGKAGIANRDHRVRRHSVRVEEVARGEHFNSYINELWVAPEE